MKIKNMFFRKIIFTFGMTTMLLGCGTLPASGPYSKNINASDKVNIKISTTDRGAEKFRYAVADIDTNLINYLSKHSVEKSQDENWPVSKPAEEITVNVGDTIEVSIFESQAGGLFIPEGASVRPGNFVSLPAQTIDFTGFITVPYAGKIEAAGRTTEEISADIVTKLENKAIEPQVVVSFSGRNGAEVSVIGDVNNARRLSLGFNQYKILDAIASAGGPVSPGYETKVSLQRAGEEYDIAFDQLVDDSAKNIYAEINDIIYLYREPETFIAYGAVQNPGSIPFGKSNLMLSEAMGLTRGLVDGQADPAEIYIYRQKKYPYFKKATEVDTKVSSVSTTITASDLAYSLETDEGVKPSFRMISKVGAATEVETENTQVIENVKDIVVEDTKVKTQSIVNKRSFLGFKNDSNTFENQRPPSIGSDLETQAKTKTDVTTKSPVEENLKPSFLSRIKLPSFAAPQQEEETKPSFKMMSKIGGEIPEEKTTLQKTVVEKLAPVKTIKPEVAAITEKAIEEPVKTKRLMKRIESKPEIKSEIVNVPFKREETSAAVETIQPAFSIQKPAVIRSEEVPKSTLSNVLSNPNVNKVEEVVETRQVVSDDGDVALIFKLDMRDPQSFFLAQNFKMEDQDIVYVANAESVELSKFLNIIGISSTTTNNTTSVRDGF